MYLPTGETALVNDVITLTLSDGSCATAEASQVSSIMICFPKMVHVYCVHMIVIIKFISLVDHQQREGNVRLF